MSYGDVQTLRSVFPAPLRDARLPLQRSQLLRLLARHGLKFWSLRPRLPTAKCSHFPPPWPGTCRTQHRRSCVHRSTPQLSLFICRAGSPWREGAPARLVDRHRGHHTRTEPAAPTTVDFHASARSARSARSDDRPDRTIGRSPSDARPIAVGRGQWDLANAVNLADPADDLPQAPPPPSDRLELRPATRECTPSPRGGRGLVRARRVGGRRGAVRRERAAVKRVAAAAAQARASC